MAQGDQTAGGLLAHKEDGVEGLSSLGGVEGSRREAYAGGAFDDEVSRIN